VRKDFDNLINDENDKNYNAFFYYISAILISDYVMKRNHLYSFNTYQIYEICMFTSYVKD